METGRKLKTAVLGISVAGALALSTANAFAISGVTETVYSPDGFCNASVDFNTPTRAFAEGLNIYNGARCAWSFQARNVSSGTTSVLLSGVMGPQGEQTPTADVYTHNANNQLRICINEGGVTGCTNWQS